MHATVPILVTGPDNKSSRHQLLIREANYRPLMQMPEGEMAASCPAETYRGSSDLAEYGHELPGSGLKIQANY